MNHIADVLDTDIAVYPIEILCANNHEKRQYVITDKTISIHHYSGTWSSPKEKSSLQKLLEHIHNVRVKLTSR